MKGLANRIIEHYERHAHDWDADRNRHPGGVLVASISRRFRRHVSAGSSCWRRRGRVGHAARGLADGIHMNML